MREREGLVSRIRQIRRSAAAEKPPQSSAAAEKPPQSSTANPDGSAIRALETRVTHLEALLEGLQDSVHRESERQGRQIAELQAQIQPSAMGAALTKDARDRGL